MVDCGGRVEPRVSGVYPVTHLVALHWSRTLDPSFLSVRRSDDSRRSAEDRAGDVQVEPNFRSSLVLERLGHEISLSQQVLPLTYVLLDVKRSSMCITDLFLGDGLHRLRDTASVPRVLGSSSIDTKEDGCRNQGREARQNREHGYQERCRGSSLRTGVDHNKCDSDERRQPRRDRKCESAWVSWRLWNTQAQLDHHAVVFSSHAFTGDRRRREY